MSAKKSVLKEHPKAVARRPHTHSLYPGEWTVLVPPNGAGFARVLGHGETAKQAWAHAAKKLEAKQARAALAHLPRIPEVRKGNTT